MPFVYGDSYGGVQSASQAADNSDRQYAISLLAAQQQAQRLAMEQQQQQQQMRQQAIAPYLQQQQMAEQARQFDASLAQQEKSRQTTEDLGYANVDEKTQALQEHTDALDRQTQLLQQTANEAGKPLADSFGAALMGKTDAETELTKVTADKEKQMADLNAAVARNSIAIKKGPNGGMEVVPIDPDPAYKDYAAKLNDSLNELNDKEKAAAAKAKEANQRLAAIGATLTHSGFTPDLQNGTIVHARTGQAFSFMNSPTVAPRVGAAKLPIMPVAAAPTTAAHWYNHIPFMGGVNNPSPSPMIPSTGGQKILQYNPKTGRLE